MKAIILAAGKASRIHPLSSELPKCLLKINSDTILEHQIKNLRSCGIVDITLVIGHQADKIKSSFGDRLHYIYNPKYQYTNNLYSLLCAGKETRKGFIYLHSDVVFEPSILDDLLACDGDICLAVELKRCVEEEMRVVVRDGLVKNIDKTISRDEASGEFIGIAKISQRGADVLSGEMAQVIKEGHLNAYFAFALARLANKGEKIHYSQTEGKVWMDIDFEQDLKEVREKIYPLLKRKI